MFLRFSKCLKLYILTSFSLMFTWIWRIHSIQETRGWSNSNRLDGVSCFCNACVLVWSKSINLRCDSLHEWESKSYPRLFHAQCDHLNGHLLLTYVHRLLNISGRQKDFAKQQLNLKKISSQTNSPSCPQFDSKRLLNYSLLLHIHEWWNQEHYSYH